MDNNFTQQQRDDFWPRGYCSQCGEYRHVLVETCAECAIGKPEELVRQDIDQMLRREHTSFMRWFFSLTENEQRYALLYYRDRIDNENPLSPIETDEGEQ